MFHLIGVVCFFSHLSCGSPAVFGDVFNTMQACQEAKDKIDAVVTPTQWIDARFECVEADDIT